MRTIGDVLIIAEDLGHNNNQNIEIIKILLNRMFFFFSFIIFLV
ncbi:hypothetical protein [Halarcobacter sp.]